MDSLPVSILAASVAFAATNIDDLLLLAVFFAHRALARSAIVAGQYAGIAILLGLSALAAAAAVTVPPAALAWLGLAPIALGLKALFARADGDEPAPARWSFAGVAASTVANGADNLGVYIPILATSPPGTLIVWMLVFAVLTGLWCATAALLVAHPSIRRTIDRIGHRLLPWALIAIGVWILLR